MSYRKVLLVDRSRRLRAGRSVPLTLASKRAKGSEYQREKRRMSEAKQQGFKATSTPTQLTNVARTAGIRPEAERLLEDANSDCKPLKA